MAALDQTLVAEAREQGPAWINFVVELFNEQLEGRR